MALKEDPAGLKQRDRLSAILARHPGVELVPYTPGRSPEDFADFDAIVWSTQHLDRCDMVPPLMHKDPLRPLVCVMTASDQGEEFELAIHRGLKELRGHLIGFDPEDFRHLYLPPVWIAGFARPITLDRFPVRVVHTWDATHAAFRTTFDALRPRTAWRTKNQ
jgi:hypothetical protein